jgi:hypothetical protein
MNTAHIRPPGALADLPQMRMYVPSGRHVGVSESTRDAYAHGRIAGLGKFDMMSNASRPSMPRAKDALAPVSRSASTILKASVYAKAGSWPQHRTLVQPAGSGSGGAHLTVRAEGCARAGD